MLPDPDHHPLLLLDTTDPGPLNPDLTTATQQLVLHSVEDTPVDAEDTESPLQAPPIITPTVTSKSSKNTWILKNGNPEIID